MLQVQVYVMYFNVCANDLVFGLCEVTFFLQQMGGPCRGQVELNLEEMPSYKFASWVGYRKPGYSCSRILDSLTA